MPVLGLDPAEAKWREAVDPNSIPGIEFDAILRGWVEERTVQKLVEVMDAAEVACSAVMSSKDMAEDPPLPGPQRPHRME